MYPPYWSSSPCMNNMVPYEQNRCSCPWASSSVRPIVVLTIRTADETQRHKTTSLPSGDSVGHEKTETLVGRMYISSSTPVGQNWRSRSDKRPAWLDEECLRSIQASIRRWQSFCPPVKSNKKKQWLFVGRSICFVHHDESTWKTSLHCWLLDIMWVPRLSSAFTDKWFCKNESRNCSNKDEH